MQSACQGSSSSVHRKGLIGQTSRRYLYRNQHYCHMNFNCLENIYKDKLLCDVVLVAEGMEIQAHKVVLATCSLFFYWKIRKDMKSGLLNRFNFENITYETLSAVINYIYKSEVLITEENIGHLLGAAQMFGMLDLQKACRNFLRANIDPRTCVRFGNIARRYNYEELLSVTNPYVVKHFSEVIKHDDYLDWTHDEMINIISSDELCLDEKEVLECVIRWVKHDLINRKDQVYSLMAHVRFALILQKDILERLEQEEWLISDSQFLLQFMKSQLLERPLVSPRDGMLSSKVLLVAGITGDILSVEFYDFQKKVWLEMPGILGINCWDVAILGNKIYCIEDHTKMKCLDVSCESAHMIWSECSQKLESSCLFGITVLDDAMYVVGGNIDGEIITTAEKFDAKSGNWKKISNICEAREDLGLGMLKGNLYAVGGHTLTDRCSKSVECYKPETDTWHTMSPLSINRCVPGIGTLGDTLVVVGGWSSNGSCKQAEFFDPVKSSWSLLPDMNIARHTPAVIDVNGQLYVIGGFNKYDDYLHSVEIYDPKSNIWSMLPYEMNTGKCPVAATLIDRSTLKL